MLSRYALKQYIWNLFVNGFLMSYIVPPTIRRFLLNVLGCEMGGVIHGHTILLSTKLKMGTHSYINRNCLIDNAEETISIGNKVSIACRVAIHTTNHDYSNSERRGGMMRPKPVTIKDGCWIGSNVIILPGTIINEGCVIAAGSVVKGNLESNSLYSGNPATIIKKLNI